MCTLVADMAGFEEYCAPGCVGPGTGLGGDVRGVGICMPACYICSVDRDPQLGIIGSNCRCSSVMETWSLTFFRRVVLN